ncbi:hypothetical protein GEMRC1_003852 [Eukaryota sp. GEM-RC1]
MKLFQSLGNQVKSISQNSDYTPTPTVLREFIKNFTIVGLLPSQPPLTLRKLEIDETMVEWLSSLSWAFMLLNYSNEPLFDKDLVKMFQFSE